VLTVLIGGAGATALIGGATRILSLNAEAAVDRGQVTLYKNPECGCCEGYADYLRHNGFKVTAVSTNDLTVMGQKRHPGRSCAVPHLADRRLCRRRSHPDRRRQPSALGETTDRRDHPARYARGHAWDARPEARPVGDLRDQEGSAQSVCDRLTEARKLTSFSYFPHPQKWSGTCRA
jgi:hypothetical protein